MGLDVIREWLDFGANVNATNWRSGGTALMMAASDGWANIVALLIGRGARLDIQDASGDTALHKAVPGSGGKRVIKMLLQAGADATIENNDCMTPKDICKDPPRRWSSYSRQ